MKWLKYYFKAVRFMIVSFLISFLLVVPLIAAYKLNNLGWFVLFCIFTWPGAATLIVREIDKFY